MSYLALAAVGLAFLILFLAVLRARSNTIVYAMYAIVYIYDMGYAGYAIVRLFFLKRHWVKTMHSWILVAGLAVFLFLLAITRIALGVEHRNLGCNRSRATL